ncbi:MAG: FGGY family carbohydrate kinase, partial [Armatimonadetes bacterium]|nr:FGGY family carbohydrate kinase [Armatimonadota bacterium]
MKQKLVLSVDIGTSSLRILLFEEQGQMLPKIRAQLSYEPQTTPDGGAFLDADWLMQQTLQAMNSVIEQLGANASRIAAVSICTLWHSILGVDKNGNAITPFLLWADSRCVNEANELKQRMDEKAYHA